MSHVWRSLSTGQKVALGVAVPTTAVFAYLLWRSSCDDDEEADDAVVTSRQTVITITIPHYAIGGVIGRQGANIKEIQNVSGARVTFNDRNVDKDDKSDRQATIRGTSQAAQKAQLMISKTISEIPVKTSLEISVPQPMVGRIIGKGGENIKEIRQVSKARINIGDGARNVAYIPVVLEGTQMEIDLAKGMIEEIIAEAGEQRLKTAEVIAKRPERRKGKPAEEPRSDHQVLPPRAATWPKSPDAYIEIFVCAVEHPHHFWAQIVSGSAAELDRLTQQMTDYYRDSPQTEMKVKVDDLVAAPFEWDQSWYRARVLQVWDTELDLYYVDFGDSCIVPRERVRPLRNDYLPLAFQAVECRLSGVEPANNADWTDEACAMFEDLTYCAKWKVIMAQAQSYIQTDNGVIPCLKMIDTHGPEDVDIAQKLIEAGHASAPPSPSRSPPTSPAAKTEKTDSKVDRIPIKQVLDLGIIEAD